MKSETERSNPEESELFEQLIKVLEEVALGNSKNIETIFEMTKDGAFPPQIVQLAEAFGMMVVRVDAKQHRLELLLEDLAVKNKSLQEISDSLLNANIGMLEVLGNAIAKRDSDTNEHNYRVTIHAIHLAKALGLSNDALCGLIKGAFLHDVGKIAISDTILLKPAKLTVDEFEIMKTHVRHGGEIISSYPWLADAHDVVYSHHEKFDGNGYPQEIAGESIPLVARIFAIIDVFDALTSRRPYKEPIPFDQVMEIMSEDAGSHFDPQVFAVFAAGVKEIHDMISQLSEDQLAETLSAIMQDYFMVKA